MARRIFETHAATSSSYTRASIACLACLLGGAFGTGCFNTASFAGDMKSAPTAQNPFATNDVVPAPPPSRSRQGDPFRITEADDKEVCVRGQMTDLAERVKASTFLLESYSAPSEDSRQAAAKSKSVKIILGSERSTNRGTVEAITEFEACFANDHVFTAQTEYLTLERVSQYMGNPLIIAWHFVRGPQPVQVHDLNGDTPELQGESPSEITMTPARHDKSQMDSSPASRSFFAVY